MKKGIKTFQMPEKLEKLDKTGADIYFNAFLTTSPFLKDEVINLIKNALKKRTRYSDSKLPKEPIVKKEFNIGGTVFSVSTTVVDKRPSYGSVHSSLLDYMYFAEEHARLGIKRDDIVVLKRGKKLKPYLRADVLVSILTNLKDKITERGIKQTIEYDAPDAVPDKIIVPFVDYSRLPQEAGKLPEYELFHEEFLDRTIKIFEDMLEMGVKKQEWKNIDNYLFHICRIPSDSTEYGKIYDDLVFQKTEDTKKKHENGELVLISENRELPENKTYEIISSKGKEYISVSSLGKRLEQLIKKYSSQKETTKIFFYPFI